VHQAQVDTRTLDGLIVTSNARIFARVYRASAQIIIFPHRLSAVSIHVFINFQLNLNFNWYDKSLSWLS